MPELSKQQPAGQADPLPAVSGTHELRSIFTCLKGWVKKKSKEEEYC